VVGFVGAGALAAASVVLFVTSAHRPADATALACAPAVADALGATCAVRF